MSDSESNKNVIRRLFDEVINHGKVELVDELCDPDFQSKTGPEVMGREEFKGFVQMWLGAFPDVHCEIYDLIAEGDTVAWGVRATGTHTGDFMGLPASGSSVDFLSLNIGQIRDGRAYRHEVIMDTQTLMAQLGASPESAGDPS